MGLHWSRFKQVISWKYAECPDCEYASVCEQQVANIEKCAEEDMENYADEPIKLLLKRTIRSMCARRRRERRDEQRQHRRIGFRIYSGPPPEYKAVLYCADQEEFTQCRQSG